MIINLKIIYYFFVIIIDEKSTVNQTKNIIKDITFKQKLPIVHQKLIDSHYVLESQMNELINEQFSAGKTLIFNNHNENFHSQKLHSHQQQEMSMKNILSTVQLTDLYKTKIIDILKKYKKQPLVIIKQQPMLISLNLSNLSRGYSPKISTIIDEFNDHSAFARIEENQTLLPQTMRNNNLLKTEKLNQHNILDLQNYKSNNLAKIESSEKNVSTDYVENFKLILNLSKNYVFKPEITTDNLEKLTKTILLNMSSLFFDYHLLKITNFNNYQNYHNTSMYPIKLEEINFKKNNKLNYSPNDNQVCLINFQEVNNDKKSVWMTCVNSESNMLIKFDNKIADESKRDDKISPIQLRQNNKNSCDNLQIQLQINKKILLTIPSIILNYPQNILSLYDKFVNEKKKTMKKLCDKNRNNLENNIFTSMQLKKWRKNLFIDDLFVKNKSDDNSSLKSSLKINIYQEKTPVSSIKDELIIVEEIKEENSDAKAQQNSQVTDKLLPIKASSTSKKMTLNSDKKREFNKLKNNRRIPVRTNQTIVNYEKKKLDLQINNYKKNIQLINKSSPSSSSLEYYKQKDSKINHLKNYSSIELMPQLYKKKTINKNSTNIPIKKSEKQKYPINKLQRINNTNVATTMNSIKSKIMNTKNLEYQENVNYYLGHVTQTTPQSSLMKKKNQVLNFHSITKHHEDVNDKVAEKKIPVLKKLLDKNLEVS